MLRVLIRVLNPVVGIMDWFLPFKVAPKDTELPDTGVQVSAPACRTNLDKH